jgi:hypothetical protein
MSTGSENATDCCRNGKGMVTITTTPSPCTPILLTFIDLLLYVRVKLHPACLRLCLQPSTLPALSKPHILSPIPSLNMTNWKSSTVVTAEFGESLSLRLPTSTYLDFIAAALIKLFHTIGGVLM